jgi:hypothetical protein
MTVSTLLPPTFQTSCRRCGIGKGDEPTIFWLEREDYTHNGIIEDRLIRGYGA